MQTLSPVKAAEREIFMDVLRGFAILGIFIANLGSGFSGYNESAHATGPLLAQDWDHKMTFLHHMFIEGKFYSIFSLLFGWGIALQIKRGLDKGTDALPTIKRRLVFMLLLGAIHLLIWTGDIVFFYALLGFLLLPCRKFSNKTLLVTGITLIVLPILLYAAKSQWHWLNAPSDLLFSTGQKLDLKLTGITSEAEYFEYAKHANWWDILKGNISGFFFRYGYLFFVSRIPKVLGMFLIGYALGRSDFYKNIAQNKKIIYWIIGLGLLIGLPANFYLARYMTYFSNDYWSMKIKGLYQTIFYALGVVPLAMAYVGIFMLSFQSNAGKKLMSVLTPVGKMAFSNYFLQSLVGNFVFLGPGLGLTGTIGPFYYTFFGIGFFIIQIIISTIWLKYFNYGPLEWLWRSATYKKWQPMRKTETISA
ncbi:MAG: DUF418 domain-containing protein [Chitinophagaceae bacterium]|nr:DUF418 domain-containing protein [Chitinophagaceae bacterium]MBL0201891.1 DUF418 domain-containing protein [Chitinophagaceae bacterium]